MADSGGHRPGLPGAVGRRGDGAVHVWDPGTEREGPAHWGAAWGGWTLALFTAAPGWLARVINPPRDGRRSGQWEPGTPARNLGPCPWGRGRRVATTGLHARRQGPLATGGDLLCPPGCAGPRQPGGSRAASPKPPTQASAAFAPVLPLPRRKRTGSRSPRAQNLTCLGRHRVEGGSRSCPRIPPGAVRPLGPFRRPTAALLNELSGGAVWDGAPRQGTGVGSPHPKDGVLDGCQRSGLGRPPRGRLHPGLRRQSTSCFRRRPGARR